MTARTDRGRTPLTCATCGSDSPAGARFCMHCAAPLPPVCGDCGQSLGAAVATASVGVTRASGPVLPSAFAAGRYHVQRFLGEGAKKPGRMRANR